MNRSAAWLQPRTGGKVRLRARSVQLQILITFSGWTLLVLVVSLGYVSLLQMQTINCRNLPEYFWSVPFGSRAVISKRTRADKIVSINPKRIKKTLQFFPLPFCTAHAWSYQKPFFTLCLSLSIHRKKSVYHKIFIKQNGEMNFKWFADSKDFSLPIVES